MRLLAVLYLARRIVREQRRQTCYSVGRRARRCRVDLDVLSLVVHLFHLLDQLRGQVDVGLQELIVQSRIGIALPEILLEEVEAVSKLYAVLQLLDVLLRQNLRAPLPLFKICEFTSWVPSCNLSRLVIHKL